MGDGVNGRRPSTRQEGADRGFLKIGVYSTGVGRGALCHTRRGVTKGGHGDADDYRPCHRDANLRPGAGEERIGVGAIMQCHNGCRLPFVRIVTMSVTPYALINKCRRAFPKIAESSYHVLQNVARTKSDFPANRISIHVALLLPC